LVLDIFDKLLLPEFAGTRNGKLDHDRSIKWLEQIELNSSKAPQFYVAQTLSTRYWRCDDAAANSATDCTGGPAEEFIKMSNTNDPKVARGYPMHWGPH
jgi:hypothetical protein